MTLAIFGVKKSLIFEQLIVLANLHHVQGKQCWLECGGGQPPPPTEGAQGPATSHTP